jgi:cell division protein ZapA (FtsZ GTPase activity inhibitor)
MSANQTEQKHFCHMHGENTLRLDRVEKKIDDVNDVWDERFKGFKEYFNKELDKARLDSTTALNTTHELRMSIVKLENSVVNMAKDISSLAKTLESFITEFKQNSKDRRNSLIYPAVVAVVSIIAGVVIGRL